MERLWRWGWGAKPLKAGMLRARCRGAGVSEKRGALLRWSHAERQEALRQKSNPLLSDLIAALQTAGTHGCGKC